MVGLDEGGDVADDGEDVELALGDGLVGQVDVVEVEAEEMVRHDAHLLVSLHVEDVVGVHIVEGLVEGLGDLDADVDHSVEDADFLKLHELY